MLCPDCRVEMISGTDDHMVSIPYFKCPQCNRKIYHRPDNPPDSLDGLRERRSVVRVTAYIEPGNMVVASEVNVTLDPKPYLPQSISYQGSVTGTSGVNSGPGTVSTLSGSVVSTVETCRMCGGRLVNGWCARCGPLALGID